MIVRGVSRIGPLGITNEPGYAFAWDGPKTRPSEERHEAGEHGQCDHPFPPGVRAAPSGGNCDYRRWWERSGPFGFMRVGPENAFLK